MPTLNGRRPGRRISMVVGIVLVALIAAILPVAPATQPGTTIAYAQDVIQPIDTIDLTEQESQDTTNPPDDQPVQPEPTNPPQSNQSSEGVSTSDQPASAASTSRATRRTKVSLNASEPPEQNQLPEAPAEETPPEQPEIDLAQEGTPLEQTQPTTASEEIGQPTETEEGTPEQPAETEEGTPEQPAETEEVVEDRPPERSEPDVQPIPTDELDQPAPTEEDTTTDVSADPDAATTEEDAATEEDTTTDVSADPDAATEEDATTDVSADPDAATEEDATTDVSADPDAAKTENTTSASAGPIQGQMRAFWVDNNDPGMFTHQQVDELVENALRANANTIIAQVRRHGDAMYNNALEPRYPGLPPAEQFDPLGYLVQRAHASGLEVHAWMVVSVVCAGSDQRGHPMHVCTQHGPGNGYNETWTTATYSGYEVGEMDFGHPASVVHMESVVQNMLQNYPTVDGIHFDFIRYSDIEYGYNGVSLSRFREAYNKPANYWPAPNDPEWSQWRRDQMTYLMRRLYIRSKEINPKVEVSAATITWGGTGSYGPHDWGNAVAYNRVFQDWRAWLEEGILDFAVPMNYFDEGIERNRYWFDSWQNWNRDNTGIRAIVPGLGSWLNSPQQNISQIERALATDGQGRQLSGVAFFDYNEPIYGTTAQRRAEYFDLLRSTVFAEPAPAPTWPWIENPTTGHMQGIANIDGDILQGAEVWIIKGEEWVTDLRSSHDGWFGMIEMDPGQYTIIVHDPENEERKMEFKIMIEPGQVTNVS